MASAFKVGQCIKGKVSTYVLLQQLHKDVWTAMYQALSIDLSPSRLNRSSKLVKVIIKSAPKHRLENERDVLGHFHARPGIRQLLDETQDPPSLVLKYLDDNLLTASKSKRLENPEIKFIAKRVLEALQAFMRMATCTQMSNILVNYGTGSCRFREVELGDCGDKSRGYANLRCGTPTDIWSFGTTLISLIWGLGWHIFKPDPKDAGLDDETYPNHVLVKQVAFIWPFPLSWFDFLPQEDERWNL